MAVNIAQLLTFMFMVYELYSTILSCHAMNKQWQQKLILTPSSFANYNINFHVYFMLNFYYISLSSIHPNTFLSIWPFLK